jgi:pseudaminic acid synthase
MVDKIKIGNRYVGEGELVFIVAEISANHLQKKEHAFKLIEEAKAAEVDAVKFQTYTPDTMTLDADNEYFKIKGTIWKGKTLHDLYKEAYTPWEWFPELKDKTSDEGLIFFSTPFDKSSVDLLEELDVPAYKIASFEINDIPLLKYVASKKKPVMFSTGVANMEDIETALSTLREERNEDIALLKCTSAYPAPLKEVNLRTIPDMRKKFDVVVGLSDHSSGITVPIAAVSLGASIIEKHFTLDRKMGGPDSSFSLEPKELRDMVKAIRGTEEALGEVSYDLTEKAKEHRIFMRSIFAAKDIAEGESFTEQNIRIVRPGNGLHPRHYSELLDKKAKKSIKKGSPISWDMVG